MGQDKKEYLASLRSSRDPHRSVLVERLKDAMSCMIQPMNEDYRRGAGLRLIGGTPRLAPDDPLKPSNWPSLDRITFGLISGFDYKVVIIVVLRILLLKRVRPIGARTAA